jgi:hypothetical protein
MQDKRFALRTILSIAVIGIVAAADFSFGHLNNSLSSSGINANATDFIINNTNNNITNATATANDSVGTTHYVEAGKASDIQAKIDSQPASGGVVFLPSGVYNTTAIGAITITKSNVTLCGAGESTVVTSSSSNYLVNVTNAEYVSIRDLTLTKGIEATNMNRSEIRNCKLSLLYFTSSAYNIIANNNMAGMFILTSTSEHNKIINNNFFGVPICIENSDFNLIESNVMKSIPGYVIEIDDGSYNKIISNTIIITSGAGIIIYLKDSSSYNLIQGNHIDSTAATGACYAVKSDTSAKKYNQISANTILNASISLSDSEVSQIGCKHTIITDNAIDGRNKVQYGIDIGEAAAVSGYDDQAYNLISGNKIYNCTSRSIFVEHSCHNTITEKTVFAFIVILTTIPSQITTATTILIAVLC